ncbi:MAG: 50S ribosomal protein L24 [Actinomycetota bacterium]
MAAKIRKGDRVRVIAGKDAAAGREGRVIGVLPKSNRVIVEGVNRVKRHEKVRPAKGRGGQEGGIITTELPISLSNVALVCSADGPTRVGFRVEPDGAKTRICRKCGREI